MYVAITTTKPQYGWSEVARGENKSELRDAAERKIAGRFWNEVKPMEVQTKLTNLRIVTASQAKRQYKI